MLLKKTGRYGFSLLEILIVITIMGILTAVVAPRVSQYIEDTKVAATKQEFLNLKNALISLKNKFRPSKFPRKLNAIRPYLDNANFAPNGELLDQWDNPYQYLIYPSGGLERQKFKLISAGPDGIFGPNPEKDNKIDDLFLEEGRSSTSLQDEDEDNAYEEEFE